MAEETQGQVPEKALQQQAEGQAPEQAKPQEGDSQKPQGGEGQVFTAEYVRELRQEAARHRVKASELQKQLDEVQQMTARERQELERRLADLEAKAQEAEARYTEALLRSEVATAAARKGIDPELAWRLLDPAEVEWDEEKGQPKNVSEALDSILQKWPQLASGGTSAPMNTPRREAVFRRSQLRDPSFFAQHRQEILRAMEEGRIVED